eukprot:gene3969-7907_t
MASKLTWETLLENPKEIAVEQFLWSEWSVDVTKCFEEESFVQDSTLIKETLFNCASFFPNSRGIQSRVYQLLQDMTLSSKSKQFSLFNESDFKLRKSTIKSSLEKWGHVEEIITWSFEFISQFNRQIVLKYLSAVKKDVLPSFFDRFLIRLIDALKQHKSSTDTLSNGLSLLQKISNTIITFEFQYSSKIIDLFIEVLESYNNLPNPNITSLCMSMLSKFIGKDVLEYLINILDSNEFKTKALPVTESAIRLKEFLLEIQSVKPDVSSGTELSRMMLMMKASQISSTCERLIGILDVTIMELVKNKLSETDTGVTDAEVTEKESETATTDTSLGAGVEIIVEKGSNNDNTNNNINSAKIHEYGKSITDIKSENNITIKSNQSTEKNVQSPLLSSSSPLPLPLLPNTSTTNKTTNTLQTTHPSVTSSGSTSSNNNNNDNNINVNDDTNASAPIAIYIKRIEAKELKKGEMFGGENEPFVTVSLRKRKGWSAKTHVLDEEGVSDVHWNIGENDADKWKITLTEEDVTGGSAGGGNGSGDALRVVVTDAKVVVHKLIGIGEISLHNVMLQADAMKDSDNDNDNNNNNGDIRCSSKRRISVNITLLDKANKAAGKVVLVLDVIRNTTTSSDITTTRSLAVNPAVEVEAEGKVMDTIESNIVKASYGLDVMRSTAIGDSNVSVVNNIKTEVKAVNNNISEVLTTTTTTTVTTTTASAVDVNDPFSRAHKSKLEDVIMQRVAVVKSMTPKKEEVEVEEEYEYEVDDDMCDTELDREDGIVSANNNANDSTNHHHIDDNMLKPSVNESKVGYEFTNNDNVKDTTNTDINSSVITEVQHESFAKTQSSVQEIQGSNDIKGIDDNNNKDSKDNNDSKAVTKKTVTTSIATTSKGPTSTSSTSVYICDPDPDVALHDDFFDPFGDNNNNDIDDKEKNSNANNNITQSSLKDIQNNDDYNKKKVLITSNKTSTESSTASGSQRTATTTATTSKGPSTSSSSVYICDPDPDVALHDDFFDPFGDNKDNETDNGDGDGVVIDKARDIASGSGVTGSDSGSGSGSSVYSEKAKPLLETIITTTTTTTTTDMINEISYDDENPFGSLSDIKKDKNKSFVTAPFKGIVDQAKKLEVVVATTKQIVEENVKVGTGENEVEGKMIYDETKNRDQSSDISHLINTSSGLRTSSSSSTSTSLYQSIYQIVEEEIKASETVMIHQSIHENSDGKDLSYTEITSIGQNNNPYVIVTLRKRKWNVSLRKRKGWSAKTHVLDEEEGGSDVHWNIEENETDKWKISLNEQNLLDDVLHVEVMDDNKYVTSKLIGMGEIALSDIVQRRIDADCIEFPIALALLDKNDIVTAGKITIHMNMIGEVKMLSSPMKVNPTLATVDIDEIHAYRDLDIGFENEVVRMDSLVAQNKEEIDEIGNEIGIGGGRTISSEVEADDEDNEVNDDDDADGSPTTGEISTMDKDCLDPDPDPMGYEIEVEPESTNTETDVGYSIPSPRPMSMHISMPSAPFNDDHSPIQYMQSVESSPLPLESRLAELNNNTQHHHLCTTDNELMNTNISHFSPTARTVSRPIIPIIPITTSNSNSAPTLSLPTVDVTDWEGEVDGGSGSNRHKRSSYLDSLNSEEERFIKRNDRNNNNNTNYNEKEVDDDINRSYSDKYNENGLPENIRNDAELLGYAQHLIKLVSITQEQMSGAISRGEEFKNLFYEAVHKVEELMAENAKLNRQLRDLKIQPSNTTTDPSDETANVGNPEQRITKLRNSVHNSPALNHLENKHGKVRVINRSTAASPYHGNGADNGRNSSGNGADGNVHSNGRMATTSRPISMSPPPKVQSHNYHHQQQHHRHLPTSDSKVKTSSPRRNTSSSPSSGGSPPRFQSRHVIPRQQRQMMTTTTHVKKGRNNSNGTMTTEHDNGSSPGEWTDNDHDLDRYSGRHQSPVAFPSPETNLFNGHGNSHNNNNTPGSSSNSIISSSRDHSDALLAIRQCLTLITSARMKASKPWPSFVPEELLEELAQYCSHYYNTLRNASTISTSMGRQLHPGVSHIAVRKSFLALGLIDEVVVKVCDIDILLRQVAEAQVSLRGLTYMMMMCAAKGHNKTALSLVNSLIDKLRNVKYDTDHSNDFGLHDNDIDVEELSTGNNRAHYHTIHNEDRQIALSILKREHKCLQAIFDGYVSNLSDTNDVCKGLSGQVLNLVSITNFTKDFDICPQLVEGDLCMTLIKSALSLSKRRNPEENSEYYTNSSSNNAIRLYEQGTFSEYMEFHQFLEFLLLVAFSCDLFKDKVSFNSSEQQVLGLLRWMDSSHGRERLSKRSRGCMTVPAFKTLSLAKQDGAAVISVSRGGVSQRKPR